MLIDHDKKYIFFHIPKTAGQAVASTLGHKHESSHHKITDLDKFPEYFKFCFVRHPVERFVSAYRYSVDMTRRGHVNASHPVRALIAEHGLDRSAQSFVEAVAGTDTDELLANLHFRPQMRWINHGRPKFVGYHETLAADLRRLGKLLKVEVPDEPAVVNKSRSQASGDLDADAIGFIRELYDEDFRMLGYSTSSDAAPGRLVRVLCAARRKGSSPRVQRRP